MNLLFLQFGPLADAYSFNGVSWSLSMELIAYFLFFGLAKYLKTRVQYNWVSFGLVVLGVFILANSMMFPHFVNELGRLIVPFFVGSLLIPVIELIQIKNIKNRVGFYALSTLAIIIGALVYFGHDLIVTVGLVSIIYSMSLTYSLIIFPLVILSVILIQPVTKLMNNPIGLFFR